MAISHLDRLKESGLTARHARALGIVSTPPKKTEALGPHFRKAPSLLIPYHGFDDKKTPMFRVRYLDTDENPDLRRYDQPEGQPPRAYLPRLLPWKKIAADPRVPLTITEGEFKAACACAKKIPCIGLGGVWSWRSAKLGISFLPELEAFDWTERTVELCFDSDLSVNAKVKHALLQLSLQLTRRGATCHMVLLPGPEKVGLDDYLVEHGVDAYRRLERHPIHTHEAEREALFDQWAYVLAEDAVVHVDTAIIYRNRQHFTNAHANLVVLNDEGKAKSATGEWYKAPTRNDVRDFAFYPHTTERLVNDHYNLFEGLALAPKRGTVAPFLTLVDAIAGNRPALRTWMLQWMAYPLQNLGAKMNSCLFLCHPQQGTGKTSVGMLLLDIYGTHRHGFHLQDNQFFGQWNHWFERGLFVLADDLSFEASREGRATFVNAITSQHVELSAKWRKAKMVENRVNFLFTANSAGALPLDVGKNRRVCVVEVQKILPTKWFLETLVPWRKAGGAAHLLDYLLRLDLKGFDPNADGFETQERDLAIVSSAPAAHQWMLDLIENDLPECDLWSSRQIQELYEAKKKRDISPQALARALRAASCLPLGQHKVVGRLESLWAVRNTAKWRVSKKASVVKAYEKSFGGP